ncbi:TadE/TadG family type IV pilus assembly protein [Tessaracoccus flavus]|uniref:Uncharacterized protein n=1 Tax=Tessaracoccus flavus TaxID=1610493 RepID=A0A1Q2CE31_9ACTN|nr:TadE/TadG family type IV pilus assembly protein [Tessaracoccus flavus]AQP44379.1 hypothetical protein RPIT_05765 [Tessaracoccus flavus]SDY67690.1 TadE-like protein [Tessaracoccus flavus]
MRWDQRGLSVSVEAAVIIPVLLLFVGLVITSARVAIAEQHVGAAAAAGARAASLERTVGPAREAATTAAGRVLAQHGTPCRHTAVVVDSSGVARGLGERAAVGVTVQCSVDLSDVSLPGVPGTITVAASRNSPVDPLRGR